MTRTEEMRRQCAAFHLEHPEVWDLFVQFAFDRINRNYRCYSADAIMHRVRWETAAGDADKSDGYKINDHHVTFYARRFMRQYPQHEGFFRTRVQTSERRLNAH